MCKDGQPALEAISHRPIATHVIRGPDFLRDAKDVTNEIRNLGVVKTRHVVSPRQPWSRIDVAMLEGRAAGSKDGRHVGFNVVIAMIPSKVKRFLSERSTRTIQIRLTQLAHIVH